MAVGSRLCRTRSRSAKASRSDQTVDHEWLFAYVSARASVSMVENAGSRGLTCRCPRAGRSGGYRLLPAPCPRADRQENSLPRWQPESLATRATEAVARVG